MDTQIFRYHVHVVCVCLAAPGVGACGAHGGRAALFLTRHLLLPPHHRDGPESGDRGAVAYHSDHKGL